MESLAPVDPEIAALLNREHARQNIMIHLIPSQSMVDEAILEAQGSIFASLAIEGHPGQRYFPGCNLADDAEGYES